MTNTFLDRLRNETAVMHKALEQNRYATALMSEAVTASDYADYLEKMYGFVTVFETRVLPLVELSFPDLPHKAPLLKSDLVDLGRMVEHISLLPSNLVDKHFISAASALGGLYVMEGSTLGGMMIYKHLHDTLGNTIEGKAGYFTVYGNTTGSRWKHFLERFCIMATELGEENVIKGAVDTFRLLDDWMQEKQTVPAI